MESIARVAAALNAGRDLGETLDLICLEARELFTVDSVTLWEPEGGSLVATQSWGIVDPRLKRYQVPLDDPRALASRCFRERSPLFENDLKGKNAGNPLLTEISKAASILYVPLPHRDHLLGVLGLKDHNNRNRFTSTDAEVARLFGGLVAVAIANARLQDEGERRAQEAAVLSRIGRIVTSGKDLVETSEAFARELRSLLFFHRVSITLPEGKDKYRIFLATGVYSEKFGPGTLIPLAGTGVEWVIKHKRSHIIDDLDLEQCFPADRLHLAAHMRSVARIPLIERGEVLGALNVVSATPGAFGAREMQLLEQVAGQLAGVFANAQMAEKERELLSSLSAIHKITDAALSTLDLDSLQEVLLDRCMEVVRADSGIIMLVDETGMAMNVRGARWIPGEAPRDYRRKLGEGISGKVAMEGTPILIHDTELENAGTVRITRERGIRSVLAVPLKAREKVVGVLRLESLQPARFNQQHLHLLEVAAERMALAIDNARLLQEARERASHEALIHRIASAVGTSLDLNQVMNTAVRELQRATKAARCLVALVDSRNDVGQLRWEACAEGVSSSTAIRLPREISSWRSATGKLEIESYEDGELSPFEASLQTTAKTLDTRRSLLWAPLLRGTETIGIMMLDQSVDSNRGWTKWESELIRSVAAQLAVAVENVRLYSETDERLRARVTELGSLLRLGMAVSEQLSLDVVMERAVEEGIKALSADRCTVTIVDWERAELTIRAVQHSGSTIGEGIGTVLRLAEHPHSMRAMIERQAVVLTPNHPTASPSEAAMLRRLDMGTSILVPLMAGDKAIGTVFVGRKTGRAPFSKEDVALAQAMAGQVAVAMENARLFQEVEAQKSRTEALLTSMNEGVYSTDRERRVTSVNPWLEATLGRRAGEMIGQPCSEVMRHTDENGNPLCEVACPLWPVLREGKVTESALMFTQTAWGDRQPSRVSSAPIYNELREVVGAVSVARDVTRDWQMDKLKSNIISVVSHEFRTPLTSIIGFSELLLTREHQSEEDRRNCAEHIYDQGLKLESLVNDFLDISRLDAGRMMLTTEPLAPAVVVQQGVTSAQSRAGQRRLVGDIVDGLPEVNADPARLDQVLDNLLSNAIKYSHDGTEIRVRARGAWENRNGSFQLNGQGRPPWVIFTVEDHGFGIPADQLSEVFTPFHRVEGDLTRRIRGTGLGLSIVKSLVELHGGKTWVESELGVGSRFHFALKAVSYQLETIDCQPSATTT